MSTMTAVNIYWIQKNISPESNKILLCYTVLLPTVVWISIFRYLLLLITIETGLQRDDVVSILLYFL